MITFYSMYPGCIHLCILAILVASMFCLCVVKAHISTLFSLFMRCGYRYVWSKWTMDVKNHAQTFLSVTAFVPVILYVILLNCRNNICISLAFSVVKVEKVLFIQMYSQSIWQLISCFSTGIICKKYDNVWSSICSSCYNTGSWSGIFVPLTCLCVEPVFVR